MTASLAQTVCRTQDMVADLSVICVNYQTPTDLREFLDSISDAIGDLYSYNLYVANVQPEARDIEVGQRRLRPQDHQAIFTENVGYARAVNYCANRSHSNYLGIFNADVVLSPNFLAAAIEAMESHPKWGVLGPRQVDEQNRITAGGIFGTNSQPLHRGWMQPDNGDYSDVREDVITLAGSALVVRRSCWDEMRNCEIFQDCFPGVQGAFLPTPHFFEETGFLYHLRHHGWTACYSGDLKIVHKWHRSSPVGGWAEQQMPVSQAIFRRFCGRHSIECN